MMFCNSLSASSPDSVCVSNYRRKALPRSMWQPRQARSCRRSCWWCTGPTPEHRTSTDAHLWTTQGTNEWEHTSTQFAFKPKHILHCIRVGGKAETIMSNCFCLCSRQAGHIELAERLVECQYELTDRLAFYLCGRRPGNTLHTFVFH